MGVGIIGLGTYVPERIMKNSDFEKFLDTNDEWISKMTGIKERRFARDDETTSDLGVNAARKAIEDANLTIDDIDLIIVATSTSNQQFPSTANIIAHELGATSIPSLDQKAACTGFIYSVITAQMYVQSNMYDNVLVIGVDKLSKIADMTDRSTAVLFGDGAGAVVVSKVSEGKGIKCHKLGSDGSGADLLYEDLNTHYLKMNGREVFKFAVRMMPEISVEVMVQCNWQPEDISLLVPHQANIRIMEAARERMNLDVDKLSVTVDRYGNTSAASIPLSMDYERQNNKLNDGDNIILVGFGGGLTYGALGLTWGK